MIYAIYRKYNRNIFLKIIFIPLNSPELFVEQEKKRIHVR